MRREPARSGGKLGRPDQEVRPDATRPDTADNYGDLVTHINQLDTLTTVTPKEYRVYVPLVINNVACKAMVDSGNLWRNVMSERFLNALGYGQKDLVPVPGHEQIGTAKQGSALRVLGQLKRPVRLYLGAGTTAFSCRPVVLEGLSMSFNLCGPFLKAHNIDQLHSKDALRVQGRNVKMIAAIPSKEHCTEELTSSPLFVEGEHSVPAGHEMHIPLRAPAISNGLMPAGDSIVTGSANFMERTDLHPWLNVVVKAPQDGRVIASVYNSTANDIRIRAGTQYGQLRRTTSPSRQEHQPWRICILDGAQPDAESDRPDAADVPTADLADFMIGPTTDENKTERIAFLIDTFQLKGSPFLKAPDDLMRAAHLLLKYWHTFAFDGSFGTTKLLKHRILTDPKKPPINQRYRPINPALEGDLKKQIAKWLRHGVVEESNSPWNFGLVAAPKKGGAIRWCIDFRQLNTQTQRDTHPIGNIEDNLARLSHSKIFSGMDGSGAFHVVELEDDDRIKTAFATPWGSYHFIKMPFGLCNAPSTYARLVSMTLAGIPYSAALPYLDDTVVHSRHLAEHFVNLELVLKAYARAGLKLQPGKCHLFKDTIEYLGHQVSARGIGPVPDYVQIVKDWPVPKTRSAVRTFMGKVGYYRRFIRNFSAIAKPLTTMLTKDGTDDKKEFQPTTEFLYAFEVLKKQLLSAPILAYPQFDSKEPFILDTDWSQDNNAVGAVLSQRQEGQERVIAYAAKKLNKSQCNYSPMKGEAAAVIIFMRHWRYYLQHRHFILRTDCRALQWIKTMDAPSGMVQRWHETLASFSFDPQHRPGKSHGNADALSRAEHVVHLDDTDISCGERLVSHIVAALEAEPAWTASMMHDAQQDDPDLTQVIKHIRNKTTPNRAWHAAASPVGKIYFNLFADLYLNKANVLYYNAPIGSDVGPPTTRPLIIVPRSLWIDSMRKSHEASAHQAAAATVDRARRHIYFPGMLRIAQDYVDSCKQCQASRSKLQPQRHTLSATLSGYPFQVLSLDFVGPMATSTRGNKFLLTVLDVFSRWLEAFPLKRATAEAVVNILTREIFPRYGLPDHIHSDRGSQFTSDMLSAVASALGIKHSQTPAYNPKSNPVERQHRTLGAALTALSEGNQRKWEEVLPHALFAMRTARCRMTGVPPYRILFGRDPSTSLDLLYGTPHPHQSQYSNYRDYTRALCNRIQSAHAWARDNISQAVSRQRRAYYHDKVLFQDGQRVWLFTPSLKPGQSSKLARHWTGPWTIHRRVNELVYQLQPHPSWTRKGQEVVSIDRLKPYHAPIDEDVRHGQPPPADADLSLLGDESAEHLDHDDSVEEYPDVVVPPEPPAPPPPPPPPPAPPAAGPAAAPAAAPPPVIPGIPIPFAPNPPPRQPAHPPLLVYRQVPADDPFYTPPQAPGTPRPDTDTPRDQWWLHGAATADRAAAAAAAAAAGAHAPLPLYRPPQAQPLIRAPVFSPDPIPNPDQALPAHFYRRQEQIDRGIADLQARQHGRPPSAQQRQQLQNLEQQQAQLDRQMHQAQDRQRRLQRHGPE